MATRKEQRIIPLLLLLIFLVAACNLTNAPEQQLELTLAPTNTPLPTRTEVSVGGVPTTLPVTLTPITLPTTQIGQIPTAIVPPSIIQPTNTPLPISIVILSPIPGNVVAGNVQVLGAAIHPQFLQYQLEYGPDPNPGNLWFPASGIVQTPVLNGLLGIWNTTTIQDSLYQLRLRVTLRDGTSLITTVNNIRIQNQVPTPIPSATPTIPRPIAAFTQDRTVGQTPLVVHFLNQSSGNITSYSWNFGDGGSSPEPNPTHTFRNPGLFTVTLTVAGPGGSSNVSRQINVQSTAAPVAGFTQDKTSGPSPLAIQFTDQSTGQIDTYSWAFGDGATSNEHSPAHTFVNVGTYNVILTVTGTGGSSSVTRKITVEDPVIPAPTAAFGLNPASGDAPLTIQFTNQSTGDISGYSWDFGDGGTSTDQDPLYTYNNAGTYTAKLIAIGPGGQSETTTTITVTQPPNAPVAAFSSDKSSGEVPLTVSFTNQSTGDISGYSWDFGDGGTSTDQNPTYTYQTAGTYTVVLNVTGPGGTDSADATISATNPIPPSVAAFAVDKSDGPAPLAVQFTNQSSGENLSYAWDFGDGATSTEVNPNHTYSAAGTYTATLQINGTGGTDSAQATITVSAVANPPTAGFTANPTAGDAPLGVQFSDSSSGDITAWLWDFGDGGSSTDQNPFYTFNNAGTFTVSLTVSGPGGSSQPFTAAITVNQPAPAAPVAGFTANPTTGDAPLGVQFTDSSSGNITGWFWDFGDGGSSTDQNPLYTFNNAGTFTVSLTVSGPGGSSQPFTAAITVNQPAPAAPVAGFTANPTVGDAPLAVQFTDTSSGSITGWFWDFGDGGSSTDQNPLYTFNNAGTFTVSLTVSGPGGSSQPFTAAITVNQPAPAAPVAGFTANPTTGDAPLAVQFTDASSGSITGWFWDFGDGGTSADQNPFYTFNNAGTFTVSLTVSGPGGSSQPFTATITVNQPAPAAPVAGFTANPTTGDAPLGVQFTDSSSGNIAAWFWDFGDGGTSADQNPFYTFNNAGTFTVSLTVSGPGGSSQPFTAAITVNQPAPAAPVAGFTANPTTGDAPLGVQFTDSSSGSITAWLWDFGDGGTSADQNPFYTFNNAGPFTVSLTVSGPGGSSQPFTAAITVNQPAPAAPVAGFTVNPTTGDAPLAVQFTDTSSGDITAWLWDFGDGGSSADQNPFYTFNNAGTFTVSLTVSGPGGSSQPFTAAISVNQSAPPDYRIMFTSNRDGNNEIYAMTADGATVGRITSNGGNNSQPAWSPDGSKVVFVSDRDGNNEIYVMNADGSNVVRLTDNPASDSQPDWSSNGNQIVFTTNRDGLNQIYIMNSDGSGVTQISDATANDSQPAWAPVGNQIIFVSDRDGLSQIYDMNSDGSGLIRLSDSTANDSQPAWSATGNRIVFVSDRNGDNDLYYMLSDGSNITQLTTDTSNDNSPVISPNDEFLTFVTDRDGNNEIYSLDISNVPTRLTNNGANDTDPDWKP
ncbi:MAG: PKD domain-containing protein [Anaerolineaceae bacterium]|nr:PKD domain-containing protein [Anaerolineaceae bacterium]